MKLKNDLIFYHNHAKISVEVFLSDLRNNFAEISKTVHETAQPVFLTKNGFGDMVVLSMEAYENLQFDSEVYYKLQEAEKEAALTDRRFSSKEVLKALKEAIEE